MTIPKLKLFILAGLLAMVVLPLMVSAEASYIFKQNEVRDLQINCFDNNNNPCSNAVNCTLTVANSSIINALMDWNTGGIYNLTFSLPDLKTYSSTMTCCEDTNCGFSTFGIEVTPTGKSATTAQGIGGVAFLILMLVLTMLGIYGGVRLVKNKTWWVYGIFAWGFSVMLLIYDVWLGYEYSLNILGSGSTMPETIFWMFLFILIAGFLVSVALLFLRWKEVFRWFKREVLKKEQDDADMDWMERFG